MTVRAFLLGLAGSFLFCACPDNDNSTPSESTDSGAGGDTDTATGASGDQLKAACKAEERVGSFSLSLLENYTAISGSVWTGVKPLNVPVEIDSDGACVLLGPRQLFCDPACTSEETCGYDETCIPVPIKESAGTVTLDGIVNAASGVAGTASMTPKAITFEYSMKIDDPYPAWEAGAAITLRAEGDDVEPFTLSGRGQEPLVPLSETVMVDRDTPVAVAWEPDDDASNQMHMVLDVNVHGTTMGWIVCDAPDTGSFEIPASLVTKLIDLGLSGFPHLELYRRSIGTTMIDAGCVELSVNALVILDVEVAGLVSCDNEEDCESGQVCNEELVCVDP